MKYLWQINSYDKDGGIVEEAIFCHVGDDTVLKFKNVEELESFAQNILRSIHEIKSNLD